MSDKKKLKIILLLLAMRWCSVAAASPLGLFVKLTNLRCRDTMPQLASVQHCRIIQEKNLTRVNVMFRLWDRPVTRLKARMQAFKKQHLGFRPFLVDLTLDWCDFLEKRNVPMMKRMFTIFEHSSNLDTKCPINVEYLYVNRSFSLTAGFRIPFKLPTGDYRIDTTITANGASQLITNAYYHIM